MRSPSRSNARRRTAAHTTSHRAASALALLSFSSYSLVPSFAAAKLADRGRFDNASRGGVRRRANGNDASSSSSTRRKQQQQQQQRRQATTTTTTTSVASDGPWHDRDDEDEDDVRQLGIGGGSIRESVVAANAATDNEMMMMLSEDGQPLFPFHQQQQQHRRKLSSQLTGCCTSYVSYTAEEMCALYGQDCISGETPSHDSSDEKCQQVGLSFIGISFSVNTALGNPYSYQLCDQFPMENIIDRKYDNVMSMDEDGWLVGGGYKSFDHSGKMPYIDSSHTELLRIGSIDPEFGGTTIEQVYEAMNSLSFPPFAVFPEYVKGGGKHHSGDSADSAVPSTDVTFIVSVVDTYEGGESYSTYDEFLDDLFDAMDKVGGGACMDDKDTNPHVSMARGVKFKSSYHQQQYLYNANLEVAVWQAMYPKGVVIGSSGYASFPPDSGNRNTMHIGYGSLYFFFDRANITKAFLPNRDLTSTEKYYATLYTDGNPEKFYQSTTSIGFNYNKGSGSRDKNNQEVEYYEHNPYGWNAAMAKHDMTDGWDLPPNCNQEGETFFGIPLSSKSDSKLLSTNSFQSQFDFEYLLDRNSTYVRKFGTNHGWLVGEQIGNGAGAIVDKDTAHIPIFYTGTTNPEMGGMSIESLIKIGKKINFGTLYLKPAFVFQDDDGSIKLQFEADASSALGYLYSNLCQMIGISWKYDSPYNDLGLYTNCAMHAAGDRAKYGCGPENGNSGGFCPQMTLAYRVKFQSESHAAAYLSRCNDYVDYWRSLYPSGVAVGTDKFCQDGGCMALFLNRYDVFYVFKPDLGGSWVEFMGGTASPTISPAPTYDGGCDNPTNQHLDKCFRKKHARKATSASLAWESLGAVGQLSIVLVAFMASTLTVSIFLARANRRRHDGESFLGFVIRDMQGQKTKKSKKLRKRFGEGTLDRDFLDKYDEDEDGFRSVAGRPGRSSKKSMQTPKAIKSRRTPKIVEDDMSDTSSTGKASRARNGRSASVGRSKSIGRSRPSSDASEGSSSRRSSRSRSRGAKRSSKIVSDEEMKKRQLV